MEVRRKESSRVLLLKRKVNVMEGMNGEDVYVSKRVRILVRLSKSRVEV